MVSRLNRNQPLPSVVEGRVDDPQVQRAFESLRTPLRAIIKFLEPFVQPEPWRPLDMWSDWTEISSNLEALQYTQDAMGRVEVRGWAVTAAGTSSTVAVLPLGARPRNRVSFACTGQSAAVDVHFRVDVYADGRIVVASPAIAAASAVSLSNIRFDTRP